MAKVSVDSIINGFSSIIIAIWKTNILINRLYYLLIRIK